MQISEYESDTTCKCHCSSHSQQLPTQLTELSSSSSSSSSSSILTVLWTNKNYDNDDELLSSVSMISTTVSTALENGKSSYELLLSGLVVHLITG